MRKLFVFFIIIFLLKTLNAQNKTDFKNNPLAAASIISVTIGGDFVITGSFPSTFTERVDQFVTRIYNEAYTKTLQSLKDTKLIAEVNNKFKNISLRGILLKRTDGKTLHIDLQKFRLNGDFKNNPYLKNDDVIIFPPADKNKNFFTVNGAVNKHGKFYFVEGDRLSDAIELAQGINKAYDKIKGIEISRLSFDGTKIKNINTNIESNMLLKRGDQIRVLADETQRKDFHVIVAGEVNMPGYISITKNNTTLHDVIKSAGGIKPTGSLRRARLLSGNIASFILYKKYGLKIDDENKLTVEEINNRYLKLEDLLMSRMSNLTEEDTSYFYAENRIRALLNENSIDFTTLKDKNSEASNFIVSNGDIIIIPKIDNTVYIFGQVAKTGKITYKEGADYLYYLNKAGGLSEYSDDDIIVIKGRTKEWISPIDNKVEIEPGDFIWVPKNPHKSFNYYLTQTGVYFTIVGGIATILLLLNQFGK